MNAASEDIDELVQSVLFCVDSAALHPLGANLTEAERARRGVSAGIRSLLDQNLISITPRDEWPEWIISPSAEEIFR